MLAHIYNLRVWLNHAILLAVAILLILVCQTGQVLHRAFEVSDHAAGSVIKAREDGTLGTLEVSRIHGVSTDVVRDWCVTEWKGQAYKDESGHWRIPIDVVKNHKG